MSSRLEFSKRTKLIAWNRGQGRCEICTAKLLTGNIHYHHKTECTMGGEDSPENCLVICKKPCHQNITKQRAPVIAKSNRQRAKHVGIRKAVSRPLPGTKRSGWKHKMSGAWERRDRPARNPGGMECDRCGEIFIGEEWHLFCAICVQAISNEIAATQRDSRPAPGGDGKE